MSSDGSARSQFIMRTPCARALLLVAGLACSMAVWAGPVVVSDVQSVELGGTHHRLIIRATDALAFDPVPATGEVDVRLYNARLGSLTLPNPTPFGATVTLTQEATGSVLVRLTGVDPSYHVAVVQGPNPNTVEIRVDR
jgi:hypothetical protein